FTQQRIIHSQNNLIFLIYCSGAIFAVFYTQKFLKNDFIKLNLISVILFILGFSFLNARPLPHYFGTI
ncbi:MAG: hypothetical protein ACK4IX_12820, partial [Candidatus Sericytochromatia bacterium]